MSEVKNLSFSLVERLKSTQTPLHLEAEPICYIKVGFLSNRCSNMALAWPKLVELGAPKFGGQFEANVKLNEASL